MKFVVVALTSASLAGCTFDANGLPGTLPGPDARVEADAGPLDAAAVDAEPPPDAPTPDAAFVCPAGYVKSTVAGGTSYRLVQQSRGWAAAEADCEDDSFGLTHLAVIGDAFELNAVSIVATVPEVWIGVSDRVEEAQYLAVTGESAPFLPWGSGEPNDSGLGGEDCVELNEEVFNDENCLGLLFYVCECDGVPADNDAF
jgi:hypothetical protein